MMKKLLILMLVLGMASMANATMVVLDNGDGTVDVKTDVNLLTTDYYYLTLVGNTTEVAISGGAIASGLSGTAEVDWDLNIGDDASGFGYPVPSEMNGIYMTETLYTAGLFPHDTVLFEDIDWALVGTTTSATIYVYRVPEDFSGPGTVESSLLIPEPATIALLGLGGLLLRRRK